MNLRPITPADEAAYRTILARTSDEDRYHRFFRPVDVLDDGDVVRFVAARPDLLGFIAESSDGARTPLGAAHAAILPDRSAELAIIVAEGSRESGVGKRLMVALITYLRLRGVTRIVAHSLQENQAFTRLALRLGMHIERSAGADILWALPEAQTTVSQGFPVQQQLAG